MSWAGRVDADGGLRWHQIVHASPGRPGAAVLIGLCSDEGVRRNGGRIGAVAGPPALRAAMSNLAAWDSLTLCDAGDVAAGDDLESAQAQYGRKVARALGLGGLAVGLGGGHEIAWGTFQGLIESGVIGTGDRVGILNVDAHFDMRETGPPHSGNSFSLAFEYSPFPLSFLAVGISQAANTKALVERAHRFGAQWLSDEDSGQVDISDWLGGVEHVYLSLDLDVLPASVAPGVSAPAARGMELPAVQFLIAQAAASGKLRAFDVAELNPTFDIDSRTARTAARLIWDVVKAWHSL